MAAVTWNPKESSTQDLQQQLQKGDYVRIKGYGGYAQIETIYDTGHVSMYGTPLWRAVVSWGPHNDTAGVAKRGLAEEDFPLGRLQPAYDIDPPDDTEEFQQQIAQSSREELLKMLADLDEEIGNA